MRIQDQLWREKLLSDRRAFLKTNILCRSQWRWKLGATQTGLKSIGMLKLMATTQHYLLAPSRSLRQTASFCRLLFCRQTMCLIFNAFGSWCWISLLGLHPVKMSCSCQLYDYRPPGAVRVPCNASSLLWGLQRCNAAAQPNNCYFAGNVCLVVT